MINDQLFLNSIIYPDDDKNSEEDTSQELFIIEMVRMSQS